MDLYHEDILEHYKHPQNFGLLPHATYTRKEHNPTCGDTFTFSVHVNEDGKIDAVGFDGEGCAISTASASLLTEELKGKSLNEVKQMTKDNILEMLGGIELGPTRLKCALLPLQAVTRLDVD